MGAPESGMQAAEQGAAESLLTAFRTIKSAERQRHATVLDYWLSIRGDKEFPQLHDLDPLEISDAGPSSILLELIGGGQDAEVRHLGEALKGEVAVDRIIDAPNPSILACIAKKLPIVAISRDFLAFEDSYDTTNGWTRCWVTLLPLSSCGSWVDYVYAFVSVEKSGGKVAPPAEEPAPITAAVEEAPVEAVVEAKEIVAEPIEAELPEAVAGEAIEPEAVIEAVEPEEPAQEIVEPEPEPEPVVEEVAELAEPVAEAFEPAPDDELADAPPAKSGPGFAKLLEGFANLTGFYGQSVNIDPAVPLESELEEPVEEALAAEESVPEPEQVEPESIELAAEPEEPVADPVAIDETVEEPTAELAPEPTPIEEPAPEIAAEEPVTEFSPAPESIQPAPAMEGSLQSKLDEVQAKADQAREAQLRATKALYEGLSAAYDFALDAENSPEEYLRLVEAQGLKIQLRAPMLPVAKLAFDGVCDAATIRQFESVLAWALKVELPRGELLERIEQAGGVPELLNEFAKAA